MAEPKSTKDLAQRIEGAYYRRLHPLRRVRLLLSAGLCGAAALWVATSFGLSHESIYARGAMSRPHAPLAERCDRCHAEPFGPVEDASCLGCHGAGPHVPLGHEPACASCHAEHRGDVRLGEVADGHCGACHESHRSIASFEGHVQFEPFSRDQHLRFSHRAHLAADLLGGPLECGDCHRPQRDGRDFRPIAFEEHCARCHRERLDPDAGEAVPHGVQPAELGDWAAAVFLRRLLEDPALASMRGSAVPGRAPPAPPDWTSALRARAAAATEALLTPGRGCLLCHKGDARRIVPPDIPSNWMPKARFDHKTHRVERCATCHEAETVAEAATLDVPGVETCRQCHGPGGADTSCATCHAYHPPDAAAWR
jgi:predicted CXXCH cytochrome family protein